MHWLELNVRKQFIPKDNEFLLKVPLLPNKYLYERYNHTLALYKSTEQEGKYYLQTDSDDFYNTYKKYYEDRFDTKELESDFRPPEGFTTFMGSAKNQASGREAVEDAVKDTETE